jgi:NAD(P)-dependent dehydrogenase (short-subunit alcohol dehydrogenase family)
MSTAPRRFESKVVLVTGASSGIGRATALALGREGAAVIAAGRRQDRLEAVVREITALGSRAVAVSGDVREERVCQEWVREAVRVYGGLDGLVNAAGVIGNAKGLLETTTEQWDLIMGSNVRSLLLLTKEAAPELAKRKGAVVNLSSVAGTRPYTGLMAYCVSKAAVDQFTRCAALDLAPSLVRVNAVNPGVVVTELHTVTNAIPDYAGFLERSKGTHPIGRVGQADEVAKLILFLLSDEAGWITGATYAIDGGRALASAR